MATRQPLKLFRGRAAARKVAPLSDRPPSSRTQSLSPHQRQVLDCLAEGLGEQAVCEQTGLDAKSVALAIGDLRALRLVDEKLRPSLVPPAAGPAWRSSQWTALHPARLSPAPPPLDSLPPGVEPWSGEEMPEGSIVPQPMNDESHAELESSPPTRPRPSCLPPSARSTPPEALNYRKVYEQTFRDQTVEERMEAANRAEGSALLALCLDPSPRVVAQLLDNDRFALDHARTVAAHHGTPQGLEMLCRRGHFLRDAHVLRRLLQNPQLPDGAMLRALKGRRLLEVYRAGIDRDLPERNRTRVRTHLRTCFSKAAGEARAALVLKTEGRCLNQLSGCTFDGKTSQVLCNHNYTSTLLIQNLARFAATPPAVLQKLLRSGPVKRQAPLRALILRHPNCTGSLLDAKDK